MEAEEDRHVGLGRRNISQRGHGAQSLPAKGTWTESFNTETRTKMSKDDGKTGIAAPSPGKREKLTTLGGALMGYRLLCILGGGRRS